MDSHDTGRLLYLVLLGAVVAGYFFVSHRHRLGEVARNGAMWALIFVGVIAGFGLWSDIRDEVMPRQAVFTDEMRVEIPRAFDGHYYLTLMLDGTPVEFVVDTGASQIVLSREDAARIGIDPDALAYTGVAGTANGVVRTARVRVNEIALGPMRDRNVPVWVNQGEMPASLLGMSYLQRFERLEIAGGRMVLER